MTYLELINIIKKNYDKSWLTPSQFNIYGKLTTKFNAHKIINIFGTSGVGKTFLGWVLSEYFQGCYAQKTEELESNKVNILDNYSFKKQKIRALLPLLKIQSVPKILVITDKKVQDDITSLELVFDFEDKAKFKNNLWKHCQFVFNKEKNDMHSLIKFNLT